MRESCRGPRGCHGSNEARRSKPGAVSLYAGPNSIFVNNLTFQNAYTINGPVVGRATLNLSGASPAISVGSSNVTINAPLSGAKGFNESGTGVLTLGGDNSRLSGFVSVSGKVSFGSASAGSANATWSLQGGVLSFNSSIGGTGQTIQLGMLSGNSGTLTNSGTAGASDIITFQIGALGTFATFGGTITDSAAGDRTALTKLGGQNLTLDGNSTYTGPTTIEGGTITVVGSIAKSSAIVLQPGGTILDGWSSPTLTLQPFSPGINQIGDTTPLTFNAGLLTLAGSGSETVGDINLAGGYSAIVFPSSNTTTLSAASLTRAAGGGTILIAGNNLGLPSAAGVTQLLLATPPTLVGAGAITTTDTPSEHNTPIIPFAVGVSRTTSGGGGTTGSTPNTFLTYSPSGGVRPLNAVDEYSFTPVAGQNVRIVGNTTAASSLAVNSLIVDSGTLTIGAGVTLSVASGAVLINGNRVTAIAGADPNTSVLSFNNGEAVITASGINPFAGTLPVPISANLGALTKLILTGSGGSSGVRLILSQGINNTDTAPVYIQAMTLSVAHDYDLGQATGNDAITFPTACVGTLQFTGNAFTSAKGISLLGNGVLSTGTGTDTATLAGLVSGPGGLTKSGGTITLANAANTYTGMTVIGSGTLALSAASNNNIASSSMILAGEQGSGGILDASGLSAPGGFQLQAGQTLAGFGTVKPPSGGLVVSAGATISGGDAATKTGNLTTSGLQVWNGGGTYLWKIDLTNAGTAGGFNNDKSGAHWDQLTMSALTVAATGGSPFNLQIAGLPGTGTNTFDPTKNYSWVAANMPTGTAGGNLTNALVLNYSGFEDYKLPGSFSAAFDSTSDPGFTDLVITYTGNPEPAALVLFAPAAGALMLRRRRVRRN